MKIWTWTRLTVHLRFSFFLLRVLYWAYDTVGFPYHVNLPSSYRIVSYRIVSHRIVVPSCRTRKTTRRRRNVPATVTDHDGDSFSRSSWGQVMKPWWWGERPALVGSR